MNGRRGESEICRRGGETSCLYFRTSRRGSDRRCDATTVCRGTTRCEVRRRRESPNHPAGEAAGLSGGPRDGRHPDTIGRRRHRETGEARAAAAREVSRPASGFREL